MLLTCSSQFLEIFNLPEATLGNNRQWLSVRAGGSWVSVTSWAQYSVLTRRNCSALVLLDFLPTPLSWSLTFGGSLWSRFPAWFWPIQNHFILFGFDHFRVSALLPSWRSPCHCPRSPLCSLFLTNWNSHETVSLNKRVCHSGKKTDKHEVKTPSSVGMLSRELPL